jgi:DNA repair protein RadC
MQRIKETQLPYKLRATTRFEQVDLNCLEDTELLALLIGGPYATSDAQDLLDQLPLFSLQTASYQELGQFNGVGEATAKRILAGIELGRRTIYPPSARMQITSPERAATYLTERGMDKLEQEELWVFSLNTKNIVIKTHEVYRGNVHSSIVRVAEIFKGPVTCNATAIILAHNHPSGVPSPSPEDIEVTRTIVKSGALLGIEVLDHIILGSAERWVSLKGEYSDIFQEWTK